MSARWLFTFYTTENILIKWQIEWFYWKNVDVADKYKYKKSVDYNEIGHRRRTDTNTSTNYAMK